MKTQSNDLGFLLSTKQLAERWKVSEGTLRNWRTAARGPKYLKIGSMIRYRVSEIVRFEAKVRRVGA